MKATRKQKLRKRIERRRTAEDRRFGIIEQVLRMIGVHDLLHPLIIPFKADFVRKTSPRLEVLTSEESRNDPLVDAVCREFEIIVDKPLRITLDGRAVEIALSDFYRGYFVVTDFVNWLAAYVNERRIVLPEPQALRLREAVARVDEFEKKHLAVTLGRLVYQLNDIADQSLRIDKHVVWYTLVPNEKYPDRLAFQIIVGRRRQFPFSLLVSGGRRTAYACTGTDRLHDSSEITWNLAQLGIGNEDRNLPVYISTYAIERLHERIPLFPHLSALHRMMRDSLEERRLHPEGETDKYLVEAGRPERKLGYFVVEVYADFVFVRTFLFLTMQGTPEARCLRQELGLSRIAIEHFKLDNFFTLAWSDVGEDPDLRGALARCGCEHLLDLLKPDGRLPWLNRYRAPFRREIGLFRDRPGEIGQATASTKTKMDIQSMIDCSRKSLKESQGWIV
jgi:hypothetical protein